MSKNLLKDRTDGPFKVLDRTEENHEVTNQARRQESFNDRVKPVCIEAPVQQLLKQSHMSQTLPIQQRPNQNHLPQGRTEEEGDVNNAPPDQKTT